MKVAHVTFTDHGGGAAAIARSLHAGLRRAGVASHMVVAVKHGDDPAVHQPASARARHWAAISGTVDQMPLRRYRDRQPVDFSPGWVGSRVPKRVRELAPDLVHLHWINSGFVRIEELRKLPRPLVWTMHDKWPITGGCHVSYGCERFRESCGACPLLGSDRVRDLSRKVHSRKRRAWRDLDLTVVGVSRASRDNARASSLFGAKDVRVIHNGIDTVAFSPKDPAGAREMLKLPPDKRLILFGAIGATSDRNKGFHLLEPALQRLARRRRDCEAVIFGSGRPEIAPDMGMPAHYLGRFHDPVALAMVYAACDAMVVPSLEEGLASTAIESMACGTPVVCFDTSGLKDVVEDRVTGYRARRYEDEDLAAGIAWVLEEGERSSTLREAGRARVLAHFTHERMVEDYRALYTELLEHR